MLGDMFFWLVANLKQGVIYFIKQALPPNISAGSVSTIYMNFKIIYSQHTVKQRFSHHCACFIEIICDLQLSEIIGTQEFSLSSQKPGVKRTPTQWVKNIHLVAFSCQRIKMKIPLILIQNTYIHNQNDLIFPILFPTDNLRKLAIIYPR